MFTSPPLSLPSHDYSLIGEHLLLGSLESGFTQTFKTSIENSAEEEEGGELEFEVINYHSVNLLLILTYTFSPSLLSRIRSSLPNTRVEYISTSGDFVGDAGVQVLEGPMKTMVVCDTGDREGAVVLAKSMSIKEGGTVEEWLEWVKRYRDSVDLSWFTRVTKRKNTDSPPPAALTENSVDSQNSLSDFDSPKRPKFGSRSKLTDIPSLDLPDPSNPDLHLTGSNSPTPLLTPPPATFDLSWPCGLTVDCGMINVGEMDRKEVASGLTPMLKGLKGTVEEEGGGNFQL